jgi:hypothetical protein
MKEKRGNKQSRKKGRKGVDWQKERQGTDYPQLEFSVRS